MKEHIRILGILYFLYCILGIIAGLIILIVLSGPGIISLPPLSDLSNGEIILLFELAITIGGGAFLVFLIGILGGLGILRQQPWGRQLSLVFSVLILLNIPIGTILGGYSLWVLMSDEGKKMFAETVTSKAKPPKA